MNEFISCLQKYATFSGRARRKEYWMFTLVYIMSMVVLSYLSNTLATIFSLATLMPYVAVMVRRLHDSNRSGFWGLICLVPVIGAFVLLYFLVQDSQAQDNQYGVNPKA